MKKIYHYHPNALVYIGQSLADADPEVPGNYLIPAHATEKEPLPQVENKLVIFDIEAQTWKYQEIPTVELPVVVDEPDETPGGEGSGG